MADAVKEALLSFVLKKKKIIIIIIMFYSAKLPQLYTNTKFYEVTAHYSKPNRRGYRDLWEITAFVLSL